MPNTIKKVMIFGTFDKFHPGHINFLKQSEQYGDYLIVVVARDITVKKLKGKMPYYVSNYYSSKYSFIGMTVGLLLCLIIWLLLGKPADMILDSKLVFLIFGFIGMVVARFAGMKKDKRMIVLNMRIY